MLKTLMDAFKIENIRKRLGFTFLMLIVVRLGSLLPVPGLNGKLISEQLFSGGEAWDFLSSITGGSFESMSVFTLSITPYITASIIIQLLTIAIPKLEEISKDGADGRKLLNQITRYTTVGLALAESSIMAINFYRGNYLFPGMDNALGVILIIITLTAGSAVLMWIGEQITEHGIGNGISVVLVFNILSRLPVDLASLYKQFMAGKTLPKAILAGVIIVAVIVALVILVVILQGAERKIPVQYSKKMGNGKTMGAATSHIPLKVNTAGVMPVIFAQSLLQTPIVICTMLGKNGGPGFWGKVYKMLSQGNWFNLQDPLSSIGVVVYIALLIVFAYFYTSITFNPTEVAENMKKQGGAIPGVRAGKETADYLNNVLKYIIFIGAVGLTIVALLPIAFNGFFGASVSFGGTSLIIIVGVIIETLKQIESLMVVRNYKGFLN